MEIQELKKECNLIQDNNIVLKICTKCNIELPAKDEYFFKQWNYRKTNKVFISICKKCHRIQNVEIRILKRCKEEGINRCDWDDFKINQRLQLKEHPMFKLKDERLKDIPRPTRARILRKIREDNYIFTTYEQYKKECLINNSKAQRKYNYGDVELLSSKVISNKMPDYYIANRIGLKVSEIPKEIIETKRLLIQLKRELKNN